MKIMGITNINRFMETINDCKGDVYLVTGQGDMLNLKSKLTQFVALSAIFNSDSQIGDIEVRANPEDTLLLIDYLIRG